MKLDENVKSILITGGTGSFGKSFIKKCLNNNPHIERLVIYSRDELKQWEMQEMYPEKEFPQLRFFLGDVRDKERLSLAAEGIDTIIHAAALKQVPKAEYNPMEFVKTNVLGAQNVIEASLNNKVNKVIALSTDKASAPINLYGATKLCSDKLFVAANNIKGNRDLVFSVVRYGNVMGSRGSVIPFFLNKFKEGVLPITDERMTRFNITLDDATDFVGWCLKNSLGGEIFVPKISSYKITVVADAIGPNCKKIITGIRPGEKINEEMVTESDSHSTIDLEKCYAILPSDGSVEKKYSNNNISYKKVKSGFVYRSDKNRDFLSKEEIIELIKLHIDKDFKSK